MSKPSSSVVVPRQSPRLALAVATALVGLALSGTQTCAQGASASFGTCAAQQCPNRGLVVAVVLCWAVACVAFVGWISLRKPGPRQTTLIVQACVLLAALAAAGAGIWVVVSAPSVTDASSTQPIQF